MGWVSAAFLMIAAACATLAAIHGHVWLRERRAGANGAFAVLAGCVAAMAGVELAMLHAQTPEAWGDALWWLHVPVLVAMIALVRFVRVTLRAGRAWLAWTAIGLRGLVALVNFFSTPNVNFREVTSLERLTVLGEALSFGQGVASPWMIVAQASLAVLVLFIADAGWSAWRRADRRRALTISASLVLFVSGGLALAVASFWGFARVPVFSTLFFMPIVLLMGFELSLDLIRSVRLASELDAKTAALQGSELKLALAAEAAHAGLWSVERGTGRLWATAQALSMFGLGEGRAHHVREVLEHVHADDRERVREFIESPVTGPRAGAVEYRMVLPSGEARWHGARGAVLAGPDGAPTLMGATIDITERKRAEEETARQRMELEHLSRVATLSEMSGALAHELNQPLAIIMSNAEAAQLMLQRPDPDLDEIRAILGDILDADTRAGEVIRKLRGLLKRGAPQRQPLSLNGLVRAVMQFLRADLLRRGVEVELRLDEAAGQVSADPVPIEQVLINVINNACDAMARNAPGDRRVTITSDREGTFARVRIADAGSGLPADPERVFEAFYTTKGDGLGMGLAISRSIVTAHGGRLTAEPNGARGTVFTLSLPLVEEAS